MSISETQLTTWSNIGPTTTSATIYNSIKTALAVSDSPLKNQDLDVYLQGSYRNKTNIYGDSDVDVVIQLNSVWGRDLSALPAMQQQLYNGTYYDSAYGFFDLKSDTITALKNYYGSNSVTLGSKSIKVNLGTGRMYADVIPALTYKKYEYFYSADLQSYVEGIKFKDSKGNEIINYPKEHISNGESKNSYARTKGEYKPIIRIFKNARSYLINQNMLSKDTAPSYFVECLLYNAPDEYFTSNYQSSFLELLIYLTKNLAPDFKCQNEQLLLFGNSSTQWNENDSFKFMGSLLNLWNR